MVLVVAATTRELDFVDGAETFCCGVGPVDAALATTRRVAAAKPDAIIHIGLAGRHGFVGPELVIGNEAIYCDAARPSLVVSQAKPDATLLERARDACPDAYVTSIGTTARVGGSTGCEVEAMEGFAVLRACELAGVPAIEVRAVVNEISEPDRALWRYDDGLALLAGVVPRLIEALDVDL